MVAQRSFKRRLWWLVVVLVVGAVVVASSRWYYCDQGKLTATAETAVKNDGQQDVDIPIAWVRGKNQHTGYLRHVHEVLDHLGYKVANYSDHEGLSKPWDLLWSHSYPFKVLRPLMKNLKPHQRVNHFPGSGYISNKVTLAESDLKSVPKAFRIPKDRDKLLKYANANPNMMFVHKSNNHRGIQIKPLSELDLSSDGSFVQEFIHNPLLIDGHKFDIGVYAVLTSVQPLRVYMHTGDVLFRFCPAKYHPFDATVRDKYVVGDDYLPTWKVSPLMPYYTLQGFGMKDSFDAWLRDQGKDPTVVWSGVEASIAEVFYSKEESLIKAVSSYKSRHNFFEMMRFDLIVDDNLRVYLMEANMSPNLSSAHFKQNKQLYRQVIKSILSVSTLPVTEQMATARHALLTPTPRRGDEVTQVQEMTAAVKDISVFPEHCVKNCADRASDCDDVSCQLCYRCVTSQLLQELLRAYGEHVRRGMCRRLLPPPIIPPQAAHTPANITGINPDNTLITEWFRGMCIRDVAFCT